MDMDNLLGEQGGSSAADAQEIGRDPAGFKGPHAQR